jgi:RimJ/RimL family protein N-acetyltransferase
MLALPGVTQESAMMLETERLKLRDFVEDDWKAVYAYQINPHYSRFSNWTQRSEADVKKMIQENIDRQKEHPRSEYQFALITKANEYLIGCCYIRVNDPDRREANIGYELDPHEWGKGYATEASRKVLRFGFEELSLHRIWSQVIAENLRSGRVLVRLGMRLEGRLHESELIRDQWCDTLLYAILENEWKAQ